MAQGGGGGGGGWFVRWMAAVGRGGGTRRKGEREGSAAVVFVLTGVFAVGGGRGDAGVAGRMAVTRLTAHHCPRAAWRGECVAWLWVVSSRAHTAGAWRGSRRGDHACACGGWGSLVMWLALHACCQQVRVRACGDVVAAALARVRRGHRSARVGGHDPSPLSGSLAQVLYIVSVRVSCSARREMSVHEAMAGGGVLGLGRARGSVVRGRDRNKRVITLDF